GVPWPSCASDASGADCSLWVLAKRSTVTSYWPSEALAPAVAVKPAPSATLTLRPGDAPSPSNLASASRSPDSALLILPNAEICDWVVDSKRLMRLSDGARSAATSWVTILCTSRPDPMPGL